MDYITRRNSIYYLQVRTPNGNPVRVSLRTDSHVVAKIHIGKLYEVILAFRVGNLSVMDLKVSVRSVVEQFEKEFKATHYKVLKERPTKLSEEVGEGRSFRSIQDYFQYLENPAIGGSLSILDLGYAKECVSDWLAEQGQEVDESTLSEMSLIYNRLWQQRYDANQLLIQNKLADYYSAIEAFKDADTSDAISFEQLYRSFMEHKINNPIKPLNEKMQKEYARFMDFIKHVTPDFSLLPIDKVTKKEACSVVMDYLTLPKRNKKPYKDLAWVDLVDYMDENEIPLEDIQSPKTADNLRKFLQGVFAYAVDQELLTTSPISNLNIKLDLESSRGYYKPSEAMRIDSGLCGWKDGQQKWVGLIALYHGCRAGEVTQLRKQDIKLDEASNRWYMVLTEVAGSIKTKDGNRLVPIHERLITLGFMDYVDQCSDELLFPKCHGKKMTQWLYRLQNQVKVDRYDDLGLKRDFHSFRHTVVTLLRRQGNLNESAIQAIVGHRRTSMGVTDVYTHGFEVKDLVPYVDSVNYQSV